MHWDRNLPPYWDVDFQKKSITDGQEACLTKEQFRAIEGIWV